MSAHGFSHATDQSNISYEQDYIEPTTLSTNAGLDGRIGRDVVAAEICLFCAQPALADTHHRVVARRPAAAL